MRRVLILLAFAVGAFAQPIPGSSAPTGAAGGALNGTYPNPGVRGSTSGATDPGTCTPGVTLDNWNTTASAWHYCSATNTWSAGRSVAGNFAVGNTVSATNISISVTAPPYNADPTGSADSCSAINAAFAAADTYTSAEVIFPRGTYKCWTAGLSLDTNKVKVTGNGATIDFTGLASGYALTITQSNSNVNVRGPNNQLHPISGIYLLGPGVATTGVSAVDVEDTAATQTIDGVTLRDMSFYNFATDIHLGEGSFWFLCDRCFFQIPGSPTPTTYSVVMDAWPPALNSGERNVFENCTWLNRTLAVQQNNVNGDLYIRSSSLDYSAGRIITVTGGVVIVSDSHVEQNNDSDYWLSVSGTNSQLIVGDSQIVSQGNKVSYAPFYSDSTATQRGVSLHDIALYATTVNTVPLIAGTGASQIRSVVQEATTQDFTGGTAQNGLAYPGFESPNYTAEWTLVSNAARSSVAAHTGTYSLSLPATSGVNPAATATFPIAPGQFAATTLWYYAPAITGTGATFYVTYSFVDKGGNSLTSSTVLAVTTNVSTWTQLLTSLTSPAPAGAVSYTIVTGAFSRSSGTPIGYVDDIVTTIQ